MPYKVTGIISYSVIIMLFTEQCSDISIIEYEYIILRITKSILIVILLLLILQLQSFCIDQVTHFISQIVSVLVHQIPIIIYKDFS